MKARLIFSMLLAAALAPHATEAQTLDRLSIHGYLTQGFAISDGGPMLGITEDGTTNYGNAALQFRYALSSGDYVTLQLSHRRMAQSTLAPPDEDAIEVDWAFYGRRFGDFEAKLGRVAIPAGIYNEIRDVGVLLPFYRAPFNFYLEGAYTSETVDGAVISYMLGADKPWSAEISAFGGEWDMTDRKATPPPEVVYVAETGRATGGLGGSIWINTPVEGVRFGGGASRYQVPVNVGTGGLWKEWHGSLDISLPKITVQSEIRKFQFEIGNYLSYYALLGVRPIPQLTLNGMIDIADLNLSFASMDLNKEYVLGVNYALSPRVVFKAEAHKTEGYQADIPLSPMGPPLGVDFLIFSVSTAF
jgi:hypothetical protein